MTVTVPGGPHDVRLVVADLDGTLLDEQGRVPEPLWPLLRRMRERGVVFVPASGRQYFTLAEQFARAGEGMAFIAENGTYVVRDGAEVSSSPVAGGTVDRVVAALRDVAARGVLDVGTVVCGKRSAYVERSDPRFLVQVEPYYARLEVVDDLLAVDDDVLKIAVHDFGDAETGVTPLLAPFRDELQVVVSGPHWVDMMVPSVSKGTAVRRLQQELGVLPEQTAAFGDYLNDLEMLDAAGLSFAMAEAHPEVVRRARFRAPSFREHGVLSVLDGLIP